MTRAQMLELSAAVVLLGAAVGGAAYWQRAASAPRSDTFPVSRPVEAIEAWDLELSDLTGRIVRIRDLRGQVVLLNFWATWCAPCRDEMPALETLARELGPRGLAVVGVNYKESKRDVQAFVHEQKLGFSGPAGRGGAGGEALSGLCPAGDRAGGPPGHGRGDGARQPRLGSAGRASLSRPAPDSAQSVITMPAAERPRPGWGICSSRWEAPGTGARPCSS
jgi:thiol-disulfide isomerase/thioredoxin